MKVYRTFKELRVKLDEIKAKGQQVGFVPTMGALHEGHLALIKQSIANSSFTVCSIFVNPTQFNQVSDLQNYPRDEARDLKLLNSVGCDAVFIPSVEEVYPENVEITLVELGDLGTVMEGVKRPGHFDGVMKVISRFFEQIQPDHAYFGEKDFQQLAVIRTLVSKKNMPVNVVGCPTQRTPSGLAMSSRNELLSAEGTKKAAKINAFMREAKELYKTNPAKTAQVIADKIKADKDFVLEYFTIANASDLQVTDNYEVAKRVYVAAQIEGVRLIDNMALNY
jgi:pantoate--beta-alanine ligase